MGSLLEVLDQVSVVDLLHESLKGYGRHGELIDKALRKLLFFGG